MERGKVGGSVVPTDWGEVDSFQGALFDMGPRKYEDLINTMRPGTELAPGVVSVIIRGMKKALKDWRGLENTRAEWERTLTELLETSKPLPTPEELDAMIEADPGSAQLIEKLKELSKTPGLIESYLLQADPPTEE